MRRVAGEQIGSLLGLAVCALVAILALSMAVPPDPLPASVAADEFSAERAFRHVEALAAEPHPPGTAAHGRAAEYVLSELRALGLEPVVQEGWVTRGRRSAAVAARVRNLLVRLDGREDGPALLLLSHYDSVPTGPGAGDAAAGVAAILEATRALVGRAPPRNDIILLITDGEESGLLGARLFVDEHRWAGDIGLVLNFEARGNRGLANMFQTSDGNGRLVRELARASPYPFASSLSYEVYRRMPNDTDLTVFLETGVAGLNFAMIGNHPAYHTELDRAADLSLASLQHHGSHALALARHFGELDLDSLGSEDAVYFNPLGSWLLVYSGGMGWVLVGVATLGLLLVLMWGRRRGALEWRGVRSGLWAWLGSVVVAAAALGAVWNLFERLFPAALASPHGEPYAADTIRLAALLVTLGIVALAVSIFESARSIELLGGLLIPWVGLAWVSVVLVPGAGYLFAWPTLVGVLGLAAALATTVSWLRCSLLAAGAVAAALIFAPVIVLVTEALRVNAAVILGVALAVPLSLALPSLRDATHGRLSVPSLVAMAGLLLFGWVGWSATPTAATPAPTSLFYLLDGESSEAWWMSYGEKPDRWTQQVIPEGTAKSPMMEYLPGPPEARLLMAEATPVELAGPVAELVSDHFEGEVRLLRVRVRSQRAAPFLMVVPDSSMATIQAIGVEDRLVEVDGSTGPVTLRIENLPPEGVIVSIQTFDRQPMAIDLIDWSWGLWDVAGVSLDPRPASLIRSTRWMSDTVQVRRNYWF